MGTAIAGAIIVGILAILGIMAFGGQSSLRYYRVGDELIFGTRRAIYSEVFRMWLRKNWLTVLQVFLLLVVIGLEVWSIQGA